MKLHHCTLISIVMLVMTACAGGAKHNEWDDIDYSRIARQNQARENDSSYTQPITSVLGCTDDDLYNCNRTSR